jgi:hypothetical protein
VEIQLPFPVGFFGISYEKATVGTNGLVTFGSPAWDYFSDYSPTSDQVAQFYRGVLPFWADLTADVSEAPGDTVGTVSKVTTPDAVAIQWRDFAYYGGDANGNGPADRNFQVVLFRDGRIRLDYPGQNEPGGTDAEDEVVALSGGTGASSYTEVQRAARTVPASSILFTPNPLEVPLPTGDGTATTVLPAGSTFVTAATDTRCTQTVAPTASAAGEVSCATPSLAAGAQDAFQVSWTIPPDAPSTTSPPDLHFGARWVADGFDLSDLDELLFQTNN